MSPHGNTFAESSSNSKIPPTTGFEERNSYGWTTIAEEALFLEEVEALSDRVVYSEMGTTVEGRSMNLVRIGFPEPPTDEDIAESRNMLVIGSQHENEPPSGPLEGTSFDYMRSPNSPRIEDVGPIGGPVVYGGVGCDNDWAVPEATEELND